MRVLQFDATKLICDDILRLNKKIDEHYFEISEMVLVRLYKAFPFNSLFEGFSWDDKPNEFFQSCLITWAVLFMTWKINDFEKAYKTVDFLIEKGVIPNPGIFKSAYEGNYAPIQLCEYELYISYLYRESEYDNNGKKLTANSLLFEEWRGKEKLSLINEILNK